MRPRIFVSAVSQEFTKARSVVFQALTIAGYEPCCKEVFGTEPGDLKKLLQDKIDTCSGLIQIVGRAYGYDLFQANQDEESISCTQYEFYYAKTKTISTWVILADSDSIRDRPISELDNCEVAGSDMRNTQTIKRIKQDTYIKELTASGHLIHSVSNLTELELTISRIKSEIDQFHRDFRGWQQKVSWALFFLCFLMSLITIAAFVLLNSSKPDHAAPTVAMTDNKSNLDSPSARAIPEAPDVGGHGADPYELHFGIPFKYINTELPCSCLPSIKLAPYCIAMKNVDITELCKYITDESVLESNVIPEAIKQYEPTHPITQAILEKVFSDRAMYLNNHENGFVHKYLKWMNSRTEGPRICVFRLPTANEWLFANCSHIKSKKGVLEEVAVNEPLNNAALINKPFEIVVQDEGLPEFSQGKFASIIPEAVRDGPGKYLISIDKLVPDEIGIVLSHSAVDALVNVQFDNRTGKRLSWYSWHSDRLDAVRQETIEPKIQNFGGFASGWNICQIYEESINGESVKPPLPRFQGWVYLGHAGNFKLKIENAAEGLLVTCDTLIADKSISCKIGRLKCFRQ